MSNSDNSSSSPKPNRSNPRSEHRPSLLFAGAVGKARGLRGEFFVNGRNEAMPPVPQVFLGPDVLSITKPHHPEFSQLVPYRVASSFLITSQGVWRPVLRLVEITSRTAVELLKGRPIYLPMDDLPLDAEQEYLWASLIGRQVISQDGIDLGVIAQIENHGAHDIACIRQGARQVDIPFVSHFFPMDFSPTPDGQALRLLTNADDFADLWYEVEGA